MNQLVEWRASRTKYSLFFWLGNHFCIAYLDLVVRLCAVVPYLWVWITRCKASLCSCKWVHSYLPVSPMYSLLHPMHGVAWPTLDWSWWSARSLPMNRADRNVPIGLWAIWIANSFGRRFVALDVPRMYDNVIMIPVLFIFFTFLLPQEQELIKLLKCPFAMNKFKSLRLCFP